MFNQLNRLFVSFGLAVVLLFFLEVFCLPITAHAEEIITNRTGTIRITWPDGVTLTFGKDEVLPEIPSGSTVEVLDGSIEVAPTEGFIQIVAGDSVATVEAGDRVIVSIDPRSQIADFRVVKGEVSIITGNTTTIVKAGQEAQIGLDKYTGTVSVRSISGNIETITAGVRAWIMQGGFAQIRVDSQTRMVHINSEDGMVEVVTLDGERIILARGESTDIQGSMLGEVLTFPAEAVEAPALPAEEPPEPEVPEASPYRS